MDAVILAGGKGSRLDGVMPPYWKPLMPINGVPLINKVVDQVSKFATRVFVIVAPENALQVSQVLQERDVFMVVQRTASGPGHALLLGLELTKADRVLVLMGDNVMPDEDVRSVYLAGRASQYAIGTAVVDDYDEAVRFTRIYDDGNYIEEGPKVTLPRPGNDWRVWCGPLVLPVRESIIALKRPSAMDAQVGEQKIGTHLSSINLKPELVPCNAVDIGTPAAIMEVQA